MTAFPTFHPSEIGESELDLASDLAARPPAGDPRGAATIRWVQQTLNAVLPASLAVDGIGGPETRGAIARFQTQRRLAVDGIVGPQTIAALVAALDAIVSGAPQGSKPTGSVACAFLREPEVFDDFDFDQATLKPDHIDRVAVIAACLSTSPALRRVRIVGHTDPEGDATYNEGLGRRRADATRVALLGALAKTQPGLERSVAIETSSRGEREPVSAVAGRNRRVQVFLDRRPVAPPETGTCAAPEGVAPLEIGFAQETGAPGAAPRRTGVTVRARLSFFQNASNSSHRNHFECGASTQAGRMSAMASPSSPACTRRVGGTPYDSGADIIAAIQAARDCLEQRVDVIHIFSHSGSSGVFGTTSGAAGLYEASATWVDRTAGGRLVTEIPTAALSDDITVVLHGCNNAAGTENVARSLYDHLAASRSNPRVFGHHNSGCASRNNSWREYSNAHPMGRNLAVIPVYAGMTCCG